jgi:hypothetical protein
MASNDVELSEEQQLDSAASPNSVLCQPDMSSGTYGTIRPLA